MAPILDVQTQPTKPKEHDVIELCKRQEERVPRIQRSLPFFKSKRYRLENPQCQSIVLYTCVPPYPLSGEGGGGGAAVCESFFFHAARVILTAGTLNDVDGGRVSLATCTMYTHLKLFTRHAPSHVEM